tara:strand:- start:1023 stop:1355 length:333 start_codon:yes stop_codon:yes gene_type:complete
MIATEKNKASSVSIDLSKPRKAPPLFPKMVQKPFTIAAVVGLVVGLINSVVLGIPLLLSGPTGIILGLLVCIAASPSMRSEMAEHKRMEYEYKRTLVERKGRASAFTQFE